MKPKFFSSGEDTKRRHLLIDQDNTEIAGVLKTWKSNYGPGAPFAGGHEAGNPCRVLKAGVKGLSTRKGKNKGANQ